MVGQDHTLVLTKSGEIYSWGLNRFAQLGYIVETTTGGRVEEPIQSTPRKVSGAIRNRTVEGIAACKTASACWTKDEVFTWGTNNGQLGEFCYLELPTFQTSSHRASKVVNISLFVLRL